jgi:hypothetical protein
MKSTRPARAARCDRFALPGIAKTDGVGHKRSANSKKSRQTPTNSAANKRAGSKRAASCELRVARKKRWTVDGGRWSSCQQVGGIWNERVANGEKRVKRLWFFPRSRVKSFPVFLATRNSQLVTHRRASRKLVPDPFPRSGGHWGRHHLIQAWSPGPWQPTGGRKLPKGNHLTYSRLKTRALHVIGEEDRLHDQQSPLPSNK